MSRIGENIKRIRKSKKMTLEQVAIPAGTDTGNLSRIERNLQGVSEALMEAIALSLGVHPRDFLADADNVEPASPLRSFRDVPIVGTVQGGDSGYLDEFEYPTGHGDGSLTYPARDNSTYALRVRGDSMRPRIKNGEFIVVEPSYPTQPGDDVVVCLHDGRKMVKELLFIRDGEVTLGSINNSHANITFELREIDKLQYVGAIVPRGAFHRPN